MSFRIEQTHPLALLRELPDQWAQTCLTSPPRDLATPDLIAVLEETRRVLREDGTLWLALSKPENTIGLQAALALTPWKQQLPAPAVTRWGTGGVLLLLTKQQHGFLYEPSRAMAASRASQSPICPSYPTAATPGECCRRCPRARRAWCVPSLQRPGSLLREAIEWCLIASTVPRVCSACGTPWQRSRSSRETGRRWRTMCRHTTGRGRCLVIDPFCSRGETGIAALRRGRDFLGIEPDPMRAASARRRLSALERAPGGPHTRNETLKLSGPGLGHLSLDCGNSLRDLPHSRR
jgi:hypothetical protein